MQIKMVPVEKPLRLTNGGELELVFFGVGSASAKILNQTNFIIIKGDIHVLVDCGMTGPKAMSQIAGLQETDIEVILPTHSHADHVGGIESLALANRYVGRRFLKKPKLKMIINEEYQRVLWDKTLSGGLEYNEEDGDKRPLAFGDYFETIRPQWKTHQPRETLEVNLGGLKIEIFRTKHIPDSASSWSASFISYGLFIDDRVFISGDTRFDQSLIDIYGNRSEIMFHDAQFFPGGVHAPLEDLKTLDESVKRKILLMHYGDNWQKFNKEVEDSGFMGWAQQGVRYIF